MNLTLLTRIARNPDLLQATVGEELMMMDVESGCYFGLDSIGRRIWELIAEPATVGGICAQLTTEYDVAPEVCETEVLDLLGKLAEHRIIDVYTE
jgi:Coenzyme PQQ synthesis protein D (PqqD)